MLYLFVILCLAVLLSWQYERIVITRVITVIKIKKLCRERGVKFMVVNRAYPFSKNQSDKFDFILKIGRTVVPVKFFSAISKRDTIIFDRTGKICFVRRYKKPFVSDKRKMFKTVKTVKKMPVMKIGKKAVFGRDTCYPVFLNAPSHNTVLQRDERGNISNFYDGVNRVLGCNFIDCKTFLELIMVYDEGGET